MLGPLLGLLYLSDVSCYAVHINRDAFLGNLIVSTSFYI